MNFCVEYQKPPSESSKKEVKILSLPIQERPREKLIRSGIHNLTDIELLCIILGSGTRNQNVFQIAKEVSEVLDHTSLEGAELHKRLLQVKGVGHSKACTLSAIFEIAKRRLFPSSIKICTPKEVHCLLSDYVKKKKEYFMVVYLGKNNEFIAKDILAIGSDNRAFIKPKDIFREALARNATMIILAHNHPSGDVKPSEADVQLTKRLIQTGKLLDIRVLDHVIISSEQYYSFYQNQLIA